MSDEFESLNSKIPDFTSVLAARAKGQTGIDTNPPPGTVDPYKLMLQKKRAMDTGDLDPGTVVRWPEEDTKVLQDYCNKMGIYGFNSKLHPKIVLAQLKKQFGEDFTGVPLEERVPEGYEKIGTKYSPSLPYSEAMRRKQILHG
jgi:hypothetical protein